MPCCKSEWDMCDRVTVINRQFFGGDMNPRTLSICVIVAFNAAANAQAQVPAEIAAQLRQIGTGVCVPETAKIYRPLQPKAPDPGVTVVRDISYATDPRTIMDVFSA